MMGRALLLALALLALVPASAAACSGVCDESYDYRLGPGDCHQSSQIYTENRGTVLGYQDGALTGLATVGESCMAQGRPAYDDHRAVYVDLVLGTSATGGLTQLDLVWEGGHANGAQACDVGATASAKLVGGTGTGFACAGAAEPPWIYDYLP